MRGSRLNGASPRPAAWPTPIPALLTKTPSRPASRSIVFAAASTWFWSVTSSPEVANTMPTQRRPAPARRSGRAGRHGDPGTRSSPRGEPGDLPADTFVRPGASAISPACDSLMSRMPPCRPPLEHHLAEAVTGAGGHRQAGYRVRSASRADRGLPSAKGPALSRSWSADMASRWTWCGTGRANLALIGAPHEHPDLDNQPLVPTSMGAQPARQPGLRAGLVSPYTIALTSPTGTRRNWWVVRGHRHRIRRSAWPRAARPARRVGPFSRGHGASRQEVRLKAP